MTLITLHYRPAFYKRKYISFLFLTFVFLLFGSICPSASQAQQHVEFKPDKFRAINWTTDDGLSMGIHFIIKDSRGFTWIGAYRGPLYRFDRARFERYDPDPDLPGSILTGGINSLIEDSLQNIWVGTGLDLSRYDIMADTFTNFKTKVDSSNADKSTFALWCTATDLLAIESGSRIVRYNTRTLQKSILYSLTRDEKNAITQFNPSVYEASTNSLWMLEGWTGDSLHRLEGGLLQISLNDGHRKNYGWTCYRNIPGHSHEAEAMHLDVKRNSIWINSPDGLMEFLLRDKSFHFVDAFKEFIKLKDYRRYVGIDIDNNGRIWLATHPKGILVYDPETRQIFKPFTDSVLQKKTGENNMQIYCDREGIIWLTYWDNRGIYELLPFNPAVTLYTPRPDVKDSMGAGTPGIIVPGEHDEIWTGQDNAGINIFNSVSGKFAILKPKDFPGIKGGNIFPVQVDTIGKKAWLISYRWHISYPGNRLYETNLLTRQSTNIIFRDKSGTVDSLAIDGLLIQPYKGGLLIYDERHGFFEKKKDSLVANLIIPFHDFLGRIVLIDDSLLFFKDPAYPFNFTFRNRNGIWEKSPHPLDSLEWFYLYHNNRDHTIWLSLFNKLLHYDKNFNILKEYGKSTGYSGTVLNMQSDRAGNIWYVNTEKQIGRINSKTGIVSTLSSANGYQSQFFDWFTPGAIDSRGYIYFGESGLATGKSGMIQINPEKYISVTPSTIYFSALNINYKPFTLSTGVNNLRDLSLSYDQNSISIETGIIDYYSMGKSHLRYKLEAEGKTAEWQYGPAYFTIRYDDLRPGNYRLVLQSSNASNEFTGLEKILNIKISPAFWDTWWFRIITGILLVGGFYTAIRYRLNQKFRLKLESTEKEKQLADMRQSTAELKQQTTELEMQALRAQMNPHFIFNSLNSINRFILQNNRLQASEYLTKFSRLVRLILLNSQSALISLENEIESVKLYLSLEALRFNDHFEYKLSVDPDLDISVLKVPSMIIQPYIENAIWHGLMHKKEKGQLDIELSREEDHLYLKITDNGIGREQSAALASKSATLHKSMGLSITARRIAMLQSGNYKGSSVVINDLVNEEGSAAGTEVVIKIPVIQ